MRSRGGAAYRSNRSRRVSIHFIIFLPFFNFPNMLANLCGAHADFHTRPATRLQRKVRRSKCQDLGAFVRSFSIPNRDCVFSRTRVANSALCTPWRAISYTYRRRKLCFPHSTRAKHDWKNRSANKSVDDGVEEKSVYTVDAFRRIWANRFGVCSRSASEESHNHHQKIGPLIPTRRRRRMGNWEESDAGTEF